jgi:Uma2 family endonuclease
MTIASTRERIHTAAEYLELEIATEVRNEYRNGEIIEMTGGTPNHNDIGGNLYVLLKTLLKGKPYRIFIADQRLSVPDANIYTYPHLMVVPAPIELQTGRKDTILNACFICEILSPSTQSYDRGDKFAAYRKIPSFREYLLLSQDRPRVEHYVKTNAGWLLTEYDDPNITLVLDSFDLQIQIADVYENIDFEES